MISKYINGILKAINGTVESAVAGTDYITPTGDGSGLTGINNVITNLTTDPTTITAAQCTGRTTITNAGMGASSVEADLPVGAANYVIHFNHVDSGDLVIDPNGTEQIYRNGVSYGAGNAVTCKVQGARHVLIWNSSGGWWEMTSSNCKRGALVTIATNKSLSSSADNIISWDSETGGYDTDNIHDTSTNPSRLTVPKGVSKVRLNCSLFINNTTGVATEVIFIKNGAGFLGNSGRYTNDSLVYAVGGYTTDIVAVAENNYFEVCIRPNGATSTLVVSNVVTTAYSQFTSFSMEIVE